jgi:hypothetical protein
MAEPRGLRTGVCRGTFDPIHNRPLDIIRRATLFDVVEDAHAAVARLVGDSDPNQREPDSFGSNEPGGSGEPNEPERSAGSRLGAGGAAPGGPGHG